ncbi:DUF7079 family protein [Xanthomonas vesicatoria]|uniref:DUF7079 family protein n=1 Tax=Xanthomonas vesicatoria TaxID=56460 RepID=UPI001E3D09DE|nr:hypothetical protein [Xanthomonas vesicatoria]MCC8693893.1 hypothetical protein [Xanthomonas vesicatoria]
MAMTAPDTPTATLAQHRVWEALSLLYLDSACDGEHARIAQILAASPFTLPQLRTMLLHEVHPVLIGNLRSVAGVWDGFDSHWLAAAITAQRARRWRWPDRWCWGGYARQQWAALAPAINAERARSAR